MPITFPSHQGLILPVVRWFPGRIEPLGLCVGAAMPDVVDAAAWPFRGELGQWLGHSLLGLVLACLPAGLVLTAAARRALPLWFLERLDATAAAPRAKVAGSVVLGAASHVVFDLVTHGNLRVLWPWYQHDHLFPQWWYLAIGEVPLPVYDEPYPLATHTFVWCALTVIGAVAFFRHLRPRAAAFDREQRRHGRVSRTGWRRPPS